MRACGRASGSATTTTVTATAATTTAVTTTEIVPVRRPGRPSGRAREGRGLRPRPYTAAVRQSYASCTPAVRNGMRAGWILVEEQTDEKPFPSLEGESRMTVGSTRG